ncbi:MAG: hypothetical protein AAGB04_00280 [Pseudomonadota bacterium]
MSRDTAAMNRMRRLYAHLCYTTFRSVPEAQMEEWINSVAAASIRRGLWATGYQTPRQKRNGILPKSAMSQARYALLRRWFKIEGGGNWHLWYSQAGFGACSFEFVGRRRLSVVA